MTTFFIIRHGMTDAIGHTLAGTAPGWHLNATGRNQAEHVAAVLRDVPLAAVASSPLERAMETAAPIAASRGLKVERLPDLREFEVGRWTGASFQELDRTPEWRRFNEVRSVTQPPDGELMIEVQRRAVAALLDLHGRHPSGSVAAVSHGDVIRAILLFALGMPIDFLHRIEISPARISVIELGEHPPRVLQVNGDSVLPAV